MKVAITEDYPVKNIIEKKILNKYLVSKTKRYDANILLAWRMKINEDYLIKFKNLKYIVRYGSGYDNIDLNYLKKNKIGLFNNPDYAYRDVAETTISLIFNFVRRTNEYNNIAKFTKKNFDKNFLGLKEQSSLKNLNIGIIGCGKIGSEVCRKISPFVSNIFYFDKKKSKFNKNFSNIFKKDLNFIIKNSNIISIHLDLNNKTRGFLDKKFFKNLKNKTIFINVSREELVYDYNDLYQALDTGKISHVGLDISFNNKKTLNSKLLTVWKKNTRKFHNRILISPHIAFYSKESFIKMRSDAANTALKLIKKIKVEKYRIL